MKKHHNLAASKGGRNYSLRVKSNLRTSAKTRRCQIYLLHVDLLNKVYPGWNNREIQGSDYSSKVLSTIWTSL